MKNVWTQKVLEIVASFSKHLEWPPYYRKLQIVPQFLNVRHFETEKMCGNITNVLEIAAQISNGGQLRRKWHVARCLKV